MTIDYFVLVLKIPAQIRCGGYMCEIKKMQILRVPLPICRPSRSLLKTSYAIIIIFGEQFHIQQSSNIFKVSQENLVVQAAFHV